MASKDGKSISLAQDLYRDVPASAFQKLRPLICPFDALVESIPPGARVLDVGCGSGLFLGLLAATGKLSYGLGFDTNAGAIARAEQMSQKLAGKVQLEFQQRDVSEGWPEGLFDVVSVVDVMHHVPPEHQASVIQLAATRLKPGGLLLYKDMVQRPHWRAFMNRMHDLVLARQWINYASIGDVRRWMEHADLEVGELQRFDMLWYGHELLIARAKAH